MDGETSPDGAPQEITCSGGLRLPSMSALAAPPPAPASNVTPKDPDGE